MYFGIISEALRLPKIEYPLQYILDVIGYNVFYYKLTKIAKTTSR